MIHPAVYGTSAAWRHRNTLIIYKQQLPTLHALPISRHSWSSAAPMTTQQWSAQQQPDTSKTATHGTFTTAQALVSSHSQHRHDPSSDGQHCSTATSTTRSNHQSHQCQSSINSCSQHFQNHPAVVNTAQPSQPTQCGAQHNSKPISHQQVAAASTPSSTVASTARHQ